MYSQNEKLENTIFFYNLEYSGIDLTKYYLSFGKSCAEIITKEYDTTNTIAIVCGLGGNGADGFALAIHLYKLGFKNVTVYVVGRLNKFENPVSFNLFKNIKKLNISYKADVIAKDITSSDIVIEALTGTGAKGNTLNKRFKDIIKRISHFNTELLALDVPALHYTPDRVVSINYPKFLNADVVNIEFPTEFGAIFGPGEHKFLKQPNSKSHTSKNKDVLIFSDSDTHISVDKNFSVNVNQFSFTNIFAHSQGSKYVDALSEQLQQSETVVFGDINENIVSTATLKYIAKELEQKCIIIGHSLSILPIKVLKNNPSLIIVTNDTLNVITDSKQLSQITSNLKKMAVEMSMHIIYLGFTSLLINPKGKVLSAQSSHVIRKDFGISLATLIAKYSTVNNLWISMRAAFWKLG